jgi:hypothetical protein
MSTYTYQDFEKSADIKTFIAGAISAHKSSEAYQMAVIADEYDHQRNVTINEYEKVLYTMDGIAVEDFTASNNRIASNFFNRLNTQRCQYSLGNGVSFSDEGEDGTESVKEKFGKQFDRDITEAAYHALIHGVSFPFFNYDDLVVFKLTEFVPLWDEYTGKLRAGIRFWQLDRHKPVSITFYREDGYSEWRQGKDLALVPLDANREPTEDEVLQAYKITSAYTPADGTTTVIGEENYGSLPIVPMWASRLKQSTIVGMRAAIDAYDLIRSGFADDLQDCAMVYWIVRNAGGMTPEDLAEFRDRVKLQKIAAVDGADGADAHAYTQEIPYNARQACLAEIKAGIYEDFGALDVHTISAGATNDHIDAAYQPMDENAADFEYWVGECIMQLLKLAGIEGKPTFTRNRVSNQLEQVQMLVQEAQWLDSETILRKLPNIRPDEVEGVIEAKEREDSERLGMMQVLGNA